MSRRKGQRLKFATWNIHSGIGGDRHFDMGRIVSVLAEIDADVVGLQEVGWHRPTHHRVDQFAYLRAHTGYTVVEGLVRDPLRAKFGNALLTRLPVAGTGWVDLKVRGHVPRAALVAELETETAPLQVAVLHLGLTVWERERQTRRLMDAFKEEERPGGDPPPAALLGDFNMLRRRTRASEILAERFPTCVRLPTYPTPRPRLSLDRIYLSREWEVAQTQVFDSEQALHASDHLPLVAETRLGV